MRRAEYQQLKAKIEARYRRDIEALERVWIIANEYGDSRPSPETIREVVEQAATPPGGEPEAKPNEQNGEIKRFSLRREIENMLPEFGPDEDITSGNVKRTLMERFPGHDAFMHSASVSSALRRIAQSGDLVLVSTGKGSEPNRYRKPGDENTSKQEETLLKARPKR